MKHMKVSPTMEKKNSSHRVKKNPPYMYKKNLASVKNPSLLLHPSLF